MHALPAELDTPARRSLTVGFAELLIKRYGVAVDVALHPPDAEGDQRNYHAHLLTTTRMVTLNGLGAKTRQLDVSSSASIEVEALRAAWAVMINHALEKAEVPERVDHRSFERQGKSIEPTVKMGPIITGIERRALSNDRSNPTPQPVTTRGQLNAAIKEGRVLADYIERGRMFIERETAKFIVTAHSIASRAKRLATLQRAAGDVSRERPGSEHPGHGQTRNLDQGR